MSDFLPIEYSPMIWTGPSRASLESPPSKATAKPKKQDDAREHHDDVNHPHHESALSKLIHALHFHLDGESSKKDMQPRTDVVESKTAYTAYVELPGLGCNDVHVEANNHLYQVSYSGTVRRQVTDEGGDGIVVGHKDLPVKSGERHEDTAKKPAPQEGGGANAAEEIPSELRWTITERRTGHFHRILQLPIGFVDMGAVKATMRNGLLILTVPKREPEEQETTRLGRRLDVGTTWPIPL